MGRLPCCDIDADVKKGPWTEEEDTMLVDYIEKNGRGNWRQLPKKAGLNRCGKSCRLRWTNYLRPDIKRGMFSEEEERLIIQFHSILGNKWSQIAGRLPGRTDNEIKNYWNTCIRKKLVRNGIDPVTHRRRADLNALANLPHLIAAAANLNNFVSSPLLDAIQLQKLQFVQTLIQIINNSSSPTNTGAMSLWETPFAFQNLNQPLFDFHSTSTTTNNTTGTNSSFMSAPTANTLPSLVPNSLEIFPVDQTPDLVNLGDVSSGSSPFESWSGVNVDDLNIDFGWKDILEQISWSNPLEKEMEILKK